MSRTRTSYRPIVAALLGSLVTGAGHLYLRRWLRAAGWLVAAYVVAVLFVPESVLTAMASGERPDVVAALPMLAVAAASAFDAYRIALDAESRSADAEPSADGEERVDPATGGHTADCPACGKAFDPDLGFCHWCTTEVESYGAADRPDDTEADVPGDGSRDRRVE
ncbi:zinc ribbon domain-containing protein [Halobium salinum]|uniref:Zinc ribbon domain-containing protein n=1 Tax=Halobium salinum TaxID=1364940 RepID=A0ABD5PCP3_9EURY|nr:zinc ribbon domain-containing protein [Halobium salinum]